MTLPTFSISRSPTIPSTGTNSRNTDGRVVRPPEVPCVLIFTLFCNSPFSKHFLCSFRTFPNDLHQEHHLHLTVSTTVPPYQQLTRSGTRTSGVSVSERCSTNSFFASRKGRVGEREPSVPFVWSQEMRYFSVVPYTNIPYVECTLESAAEKRCRYSQVLERARY